MLDIISEKAMAISHGFFCCHGGFFGTLKIAAIV